MGVGGTDHAKLERVDAQIHFVGETALECLTRVFLWQHIGCLRRRAELALVPGFEIGKLVVGGQGRMRLAIALHLRDFVERFPTCAPLGRIMCIFFPRVFDRVKFRHSGRSAVDTNCACGFFGERRL
jgi:hypothetical protein